MFTRFSKSTIVNKQLKNNNALVDNVGNGVIVSTTGGSNVGVMQWFFVGSLGNAQFFGNNPIQATTGAGACASTTRGVQMGGEVSGPPYTASDWMNYITFATRSDVISFGTLAVTRGSAGSVSSATRGVYIGGSASGLGNRTNMEYITIATTGNGTNFGNLNVSSWDYLRGGGNSPTRGVFGGGFRNGGSNSRIDYITIATTGDSTNFGNLTVARYMPSASGSDTRAIWVGGGYSPSTIDYVTIASTGNAVSFGSMLYNTDASGASGSNNVRMVTIGGGSNTVGIDNKVLQYVTIASTGNMLDFGDSLTYGNGHTMANNHGGLQ